MSELPTKPETELVLHGEEQDLAYLQGLMPVLGDFVWIAQLATNGNLDELPHFVDNPASFGQKLLFDDRSRLLQYMKVRALRGFLEKPSKKDPLEHGKFLLELMKLEKELQSDPPNGVSEVPQDTKSRSRLLERLDKAE